jgi:hypothetical protein
MMHLQLLSPEQQICPTPTRMRLYFFNETIRAEEEEEARRRRQVSRDENNKSMHTRKFD